MNLPLYIKRPFIWLSRFRYRCGYGVHSPFAFSLITDVIYEKKPYYDYCRLGAEQKEMQKKGGYLKSPIKVNRLLFRLVNMVQPCVIVEAGRPSVASIYLQAPKRCVRYVMAADRLELQQSPDCIFDFIYLNDYENPQLVEEMFDACAGHTSRKSLCVVFGIRYSEEMKALWKRLQEDDRVGITFDLYDLGLLFFDKTKIKQHYIVNF